MKWMAWTGGKYAHQCGEHDGIAVDLDEKPIRSHDGLKEWEWWIGKLVEPRLKAERFGSEDL
jgi:hypothetical protein